MNKKKRKRVGCKEVNFCGNCGLKLGMPMGYNPRDIIEYVCPNFCLAHACQSQLKILKKKVIINGYYRQKKEINRCSGIMKWNSKCKWNLYVNHNFCVECGKKKSPMELFRVWQKNINAQKLSAEMYKYIETFL